MSNHRTIEEAGRCPLCRTSNIGLVANAPNGFALIFDGCVAFVRSWDPTIGGAAETAWATGCNASGHVHIHGPFPAAALEETGVRLFELIDVPAATVALSNVLAVAEEFAVDDEEPAT